MASVSHKGGSLRASIREFLSGRTGTLGFWPFRGRMSRSSPRGSSDSRVHISVSGQNNFFTDGLTAATGDICTISGHYIRALGTTATSDTWAEFLAIDQANVEARLRDVLLVESGIDPNNRGLMILDMEGDADGHSCHPSDLHLESAADQTALIAAWRTRISAVRAVFPNAKLGLYGTVVPNGRGTPDNATYLARLAALIAAGAAGAYDDLDYHIPILFSRFGPNDTVGAWTSYGAMTEQGILGARQLLKSNGASLPLMPLMSFSILNTSSVDNAKMLFDLSVADPIRHTLGVQVAKLKELGEYHAGLWVSSGNTQVIQHEDNTGRGYTVNQYTQALLDIEPL